MPKQCDGDCLSCDVDTYITCEKRINPNMKYSALERLDIKFTELVGAIEEKQVDGQLSSKDHGDYELVCYCRGFIRVELEKERRATHTSPPAPEQQMQISDIIKDLEQSLKFYKDRVNMLQCWQSSMRDPERKIVCDILANGFTLTTKEEVDKAAKTEREKVLDEILKHRSEISIYHCHEMSDLYDLLLIDEDKYLKSLRARQEQKK